MTKILITRNMTVTNGRGSAEAFTKSEKPLTIGIELDFETYRRLKRAGAAKIFPDEVNNETNIIGIDSVNDVDLNKLPKETLEKFAEAHKIDIGTMKSKSKILEAIKDQISQNNG